MKLTASQVSMALITFLVAAALALAHLFDLSVYRGATPQDLVAGTGDLPYQYRILLPWLVSLLEHTPLTALLARLFSPLGLGTISAHFGSSREVTATLMLLEIAATVGVLVSFFILTAQFVIGPLRQAGGVLILVALLATLQALTSEEHFYYPSDTPAVLVVILAYLLLLRGRLAAFYSLFIIGSFNRETTLFLIPLVWSLPSDVLGAPTLLRTLCGPIHSIALLAIWAAIKFTLFLQFRGNRGYVMHPNLFDNLSALQSPTTFATTVVPLLLSIVVGILAYQRTGQPLLKSASIAGIFFLAGMFFAGTFRELRIYAELTPLIALCALVLVTPIAKLRLASRPLKE